MARSRLRARLAALALMASVMVGGLVLSASPASAATIIHKHKIVVSIRLQHFWAYDNGQLVVQGPVTTGRPSLPTPPGRYHILFKRSPFRFVSPWPWWSPYYYNPAWTNYAMEFESSGYFLHDAPWRTWYGPGSNVWAGTHGCVNIPLRPMRILYQWARVGDEVLITRN